MTAAKKKPAQSSEDIFLTKSTTLSIPSLRPLWRVSVLITGTLLLNYQGQFFRQDMQAHFGSVRLS